VGIAAAVFPYEPGSDEITIAFFMRKMEYLLDKGSGNLM
jgi:hypothetical protein